MTILVVTGHRPPKVGGYKVPNPVYTSIVAELKKKILEINPTLVYTGMALGVDQWVAQICIDLNIPFVAAIPHKGHAFKWPPYTQTQYHSLLAKASETIIVSDKPYFPGAMQIRNKWMVDRASRALAVYDGSEGGTSNCVNYIKSKGMDLTTIDPKEFIKAPISFSPDINAFKGSPDLGIHSPKIVQQLSFPETVLAEFVKNPSMSTILAGMALPHASLEQSLLVDTEASFEDAFLLPQKILQHQPKAKKTSLPKKVTEKEDDKLPANPYVRFVDLD